MPKIAFAAPSRSVEPPLPLPRGGVFVGVFPDDCAFGALDEKGDSLKFRGEDEVKGKELAPGTWLFYPANPTQCAGVAVFLKLR